MQQKSSSTFWLRFLFTVFTLFMIPALLGILNKTGCFILLWQKDDLSGIQHDSGYAYYVRIPNENAAKLDLPLFLIEDNVLINPPVLAVNQDLPRDIKETGKGLYELLPNNNIFFSSTDETDPTTGKHTYAVLTPTIIRVRYLLPVIAIPSLIFIILCFIWLTAKIRKDRPALINIKACAKDSAKTLSIFILILLMIPWKDFFNPPVIAVKNLQWVMPLIQRNIVYFLILAVCLLYLFRMKQSNKILYGLMGCILILNTGYYFMPEKDYYGVRTDSASYISAYDAHSIRTPGYPRFIEDVMTLSPNSDLDYWRSETGQKELSDTGRTAVQGSFRRFPRISSGCPGAKSLPWNQFPAYSVITLFFHFPLFCVFIRGICFSFRFFRCL